MIVSLTIGNYLSFKEKVTISFIPKSTKDNENDAIFSTKYSDLDLLKGGAFIGANAGGKSNVLKAVSFMRRFILESWHTGANDPIDVESFKLNSKFTLLPSFFELTFLIEDVKYRYGFEVSKTKVEKEWLFYSTKKSEKKYFERNDNLIDIMKDFSDGLKNKSLTRSNALLLSTAAQHNGSISLKISKWFNDLVIISDSNHQDFIQSTVLQIDKNSTFKSYFKQLIEVVDLGFDDFEIISVNYDINIINALPEELRKQFKGSQKPQIKTIHKRFDNSGNVVENVHFDLLNEESQGTIKYFALAGPIIECLMAGKPLFIDELDSRFHPDLSSAIIQMFNSKDKNPNNAQLIFTTHNHNFLEDKLLRRDQVFFVEKNSRGETSISYTMLKKKVRKDASYKKDYDTGKYGAKPNIKANQLKLF